MLFLTGACVAVAADRAQVSRVQVTQTTMDAETVSHLAYMWCAAVCALSYAVKLLVAVCSLSTEPTAKVKIGLMSSI